MVRLWETQVVHLQKKCDPVPTALVGYGCWSRTEFFPIKVEEEQLLRNWQLILVCSL
jgi:hypothetical protein